MAELTYQQRERLPDSAFVYPEERKYPIHDEAHARNALARVGTFGSPAEIAKVRAAVHKKYPQIEMAEKTKGIKVSSKGRRVK